jgi:hypothetical protein
MPLYRGGQRIAKLYRGASPIARAYRGSELKFDSADGPGFPVLIGTNTSATTSATSSHSVALPSGIVAGMRLIVAFSVQGDAGPGTPSGWSVLADANSGAGGSDERLVLYQKIAGGSEGASLSIATSNNRGSAHNSFLIGGGGAPEAAASNGTSATPDPPNLTPAGGSGNYLWLAINGYVVNAARAVSAFPADYSDGIQVQASGTTNRPGCGSARRTLAAAGENPGAFTMSGSLNGWAAATIAIPPA